MMAQILQMNPNDNIAIAITDIKAGDQLMIFGKKIYSLQDVPPGHKIAVRHICAGEQVLKYGYPIGAALYDISPGAWVHTHNLKTELMGLIDYQYKPIKNILVPQEPKHKFMGYRRADGSVGVRNEIWIIPTVGCVNSVAHNLEQQTSKILTYGVDGIYAFTHPYGCSQCGQDLSNTKQILAGLVHHPNAAGVLVLGLGCENNTIESFKRILGSYGHKNVQFLNCQDVSNEVECGMAILEEMVKSASVLSRTEVSIEELVIGLKCGGSDGFSGITANPLVGQVTDCVIAQGGTALMSEVPEMFGAEVILMNRARNKNVFDAQVTMINDFKKYYLEHNQPIYENPSPGNKEGGITTLEEKSLGCIKKGGTSPVVDVLDYGQKYRLKGLSIVKSPGNDLISCTALAVAGAQLILFTTGRGTPMGSPVPTIKISTNSHLAKQKSNWIDFDAGVLLNGVDFDLARDCLLEKIMLIASGECPTCSEINHSRDMAIFKDGVTL